MKPLPIMCSIQPCFTVCQFLRCGSAGGLLPLVLMSMLCSYDSVPRGGSLVRANPPSVTESRLTRNTC